MRRLLILLIVLGILTLGCTQHVQKHVGQTVTPKPEKTPLPIQDINKTLSEVNDLLNQLQNVENVSFNL